MFKQTKKIILQICSIIYYRKSGLSRFQTILLMNNFKYQFLHQLNIVQIVTFNTF